MKLRSLEDFFGDNAPVRDHDYSASKLNLSSGTIHDGIPGSITPGSLTSDSGDAYAVTLTAGVTYSFSQRATASGGMEDPLLFLYDGNGNFITYDDDGGAGRGSLLSFTPTTSGTYYLVADSWVNSQSSGGDRGGYELVQWDSTQPDAGATIATAMSIGLGLTTGSRTARSDIDMYKIDMTKGLVYTFAVSGGYDGAGELGTVSTVQVLDANGNVLVSNLAAESGTSYFPPADGTYYVKIIPHGSAGAAAGGYTLDVAAIDPATRDPLEAFVWDSANNVTPDAVVDGVPTVYVYFGAAGETFGTGEVTYGWSAAQKAAVMSALNDVYSKVTGYNYVVTTNVNDATFRMQTVQNNTYGARFYPQDPAYGALQGIGSFNLLSGGFGTDPSSLLPGGFAYGVILHELGHAHGIAHPHDNGGGSEIMLGVTASQGSRGVYDLNQGVYSVMSYNDGWDLHPDGDRNYSAINRSSGWSSTLGAFDIAVLQERGYVAPAQNVGNTTYTIADVQAQSSYKTIVDNGGTDTISYTGARDAQIDLLAATLDYTPTGGGVVSFAHGVWGGFTIANGVVIENATGGSGNDVLLGNSVANTLTGNDGNDALMGRAGNDLLIGGIGNDKFTGGDGLDVIQMGAGNDTFVAEVTASKITTKGPNKGTMSIDVITDFAHGADHIDVSAFAGLHFNGTSANKASGDLTYKTFGSINSAENALGIEIDGNPGAGGVGGPVTVVFADVDGGGADFAIVLLNTSSVSTSDFIFGS